MDPPPSLWSREWRGTKTSFFPWCLNCAKQDSVEQKSLKQASRQINKWATYSTFFDHSGGLLKVMNTQLVKIVHIMIMLNTVEKSQGRIYKIWPVFFLWKQTHVTLGITRIKSVTWKETKHRRRGEGKVIMKTTIRTECHCMYPHLPGELWVDTAGWPLAFKRAVTALLLSDTTSPPPATLASAME